MFSKKRGKYTDFKLNDFTFILRKWKCILTLIYNHNKISIPLKTINIALYNYLNC